MPTAGITKLLPMAVWFLVACGDSVEAPCKPAGTVLKRGATSFVSVASLCDDPALTCVEERCVPIPVCAANVDGVCRFEPERSAGRVVDVKAADNYVYWLERGTIDDRHNPKDDAVLARARIGDWKRELVATGFQGLGKSLWLLDDVAFVQTSDVTGDRSLDKSFFVDGLAPGARVVVDPIAPRRQRPQCAVGRTQYWISQPQYGLSEVRARSLEPDLLDEVATITTGAEGGASCAELDGRLYFDGWEGPARHGVLTDFDLAAPSEVSKRALPRSMVLLGAADNRLIGLRSDGWVLTAAPAPGDEELEWRNVAGSGDQYTTGFSLTDTHVMWIGYEQPGAQGPAPAGAQDATSDGEPEILTGDIFRGRLDSRGEQQHVGRLPGGAGSGLLPTRDGVIVTHRDGREPIGMHYVPIPGR